MFAKSSAGSSAAGASSTAGAAEPPAAFSTTAASAAGALVNSAMPPPTGTSVAGVSLSPLLVDGSSEVDLDSGTLSLLIGLHFHSPTQLPPATHAGTDPGNQKLLRK